MSPISKHLRQLRLQFSYTQGDIAEILGIAQATVSAVELGTKSPSQELLEKYIEKLELNEVETNELWKENSASKTKFTLSPDSSEETFRFCNDLWEQIETLHPALLNTLQKVLNMERSLKSETPRTPDRLKRRVFNKGTEE
jgi:transcriptional regulator with XRE-family HTH domain